MTHPFPHHPRFAVSARTGLGRAAALTFDGGYDGGPALLVPVDVQALVSTVDDPAGHADVRTRIFDLAVPGGPRVPEPFAPDLPDRAPGVFLHWAMPDGLTGGRTTGPDGAPRWRPLPDRWVVLRLLPGEGNLDRRPVEGWLIEAERRRVHPLDTWRPGPPDVTDPPPATPRLDPADLNAMLGGDPAWAAIFDNVEDRFAIHDRWDKLPGPPPGHVAYLVVGWYSQPRLDPLGGLETSDGFHARLSELAWTVDASRLTALQEAAGRAATQRASVGLAAVTQTRAWWPRRCVFHGVVYGVRTEEPPPDQRPDATRVRVAIGESAEQAAAAMLASALGEPETETLHAAFHLGLADTLGEPDGPAQVEAEMHAAGFASAPGEEIVERVLDGDPFEGVRPPPATPATDALLAEHPDRTVRFEFTTGGDRAADRHTAAHTPERGAVPPEPRTVREVRRPGPRWFTARDPSIVVSGLNRSLRHGYDGRFEPGDTLACRLTGDPVTRLLGFLDGDALLERGVEHGAVPPEAEALLREAAIEDPFEDYRNLLERFTNRFGYTQFELLKALRAESRLFRRWLADPARGTYLMAASLKDGTGPSPAGITIWRPAWVPLYLQWQVAVDLDPAQARWPLGELDRQPPEQASAGPEATVRFTGQSLLTPSSARTLSDQIRVFLAAEDQLDLAGRGLIPEDLEATLHKLGQEAGRADLLTAGVDGLGDRLLGFTGDVTYGGADRLPTEPPRTVRAGALTVERVRVVDAFARSLVLIDKGAPAPALAAGLRGEPDGPAVLRPRITRPARLLLRLTEAGDDQRTVVVDQSPGTPAAGPIAGWLLPDHADAALELFDPDGAPLGQLAHEPLTGAVTWEAEPGGTAAIGGRPEETLSGPRLRHLNGLARALLDRDVAERAALPAGHVRSDTPLEALLRVIDTTAATIAPAGSTEHVAQLVGRPVAVVRASLRLEVRPEPAIGGAAEAFPVRLGALTRLDDGLLGYFVDDDYARFFPVHDSVAGLAVDSGPHHGDLAAAGSAPAGTRPLVSGWLSADPVVWLRPGRTVMLTLLQDPAGKVHATCGVLPRKEISLVRDWIAVPLARLVPTLRVGPVLVDPAAIRMPVTSRTGERREWVRRDGPASWRQDPITTASGQALLPETAAVVQEGWVRVTADDPQAE
ncbi:hypothetical protein [Actinoplanes sp. NBRC 103695]|uniref:hypothetical protein n=1 Tax=Actinoplanes sp. NBRC 103695 TaxID=3032202 RepID=UPI0024A56747|nr:hypothetical protein [Actinoplanes sp. NBRC 103695]GLY99560.1 hypothetical protein Acsp02_68130 [Actinoplanes sp. NBRC 103695]